MRIEGVAQGLTAYMRAKQAQKTSKEPSFKEILKDTYESTANEKAPQANIALDSIRLKVKAGYYSRDSVAEDISDKLAKIFDKESDK